MTAAADAHLDWFAFLQSRLRSAVALAMAAGSELEDPLRGLYISDEQARALAEDGPATAEGALGDAPARIVDIGERLGLDDLDRSVLALCAAPELDPRYGRLYAYLHDDVTRKLASPRLAADLLAGDGIERWNVLASFALAAPLSRWGAIRAVGSDPVSPLADRPVKIADRLTAYLLGTGALMVEGSTASLRRVDPDPRAGRPESVRRIAELLSASTRLPLVVCGPDGATLLATAAQTPVLVLGIRDLERSDAIADARLAAALAGALVCLDGLEDASVPERERLGRLIDEAGERIVLVSDRPRDVSALLDRPLLTVTVAHPTYAERRHAWCDLTGSVDTDDVAAKFRLSLDQIRVAAEVSLISAGGRGETAPSGTDLDLGARRSSSSRLGDLATRLDPGFGWDDLVLPDRHRDLLRSISAYLRHRDRVLSQWGYETTVSRTQGLKVLFAGESGTGKTMAAQVLGAELGLELFRVDLATVVSKYIGETEKNLERIFTAADGSNAILFFDEADALFGKRSEVSDAHDRYANIEVAYLLQRMEAYPGAVILATNLRRNIDDAFARRLDFVIDFPFPEADDRRRIWELVLPAAAPIGDDVDLDFLANQFKLSGGAIRNCSLTAAFRAADEESRIEMRHLVQAVAQEYGKQGRLTLEADFERFHAALRR